MRNWSEAIFNFGIGNIEFGIWNFDFGIVLIWNLGFRIWNCFDLEFGISKLEFYLNPSSQSQIRNPKFQIVRSQIRK